HADDLLRMFVLVPPNKESAYRLANEHIWRMLAGTPHRGFQIVGDLLDRVFLRPRITPAVTGTIVRANACRFCNFRLYECPVYSEGSGTRFQDYSRTAFASAVQVRSEEHTSELQSRFDLVCRLLLEKKKKKIN